MNSTDDDFARTDPVRPGSIVISDQELTILSTVAHELGNIQEPRLVRAGSSAANVREVSSMLRSAVERAASGSRVLPAPADPSHDGRATGSVEHTVGSDPPAKLRVNLPLENLHVLRALCDLVLLALGSREIRYRTGYYVEEIRPVVLMLDAGL